MKILVLGTGGVGGYFGGHLAARGADVTFVARGQHLGALKRDGLRVESGVGQLHLQPVQATDNPGDAGVVDVVMIAVKLWDTESAARAALPAVGPQTAVVSFQNGVDAVDVLTRTFGAERVMGGVAHIAAVIESPGVIRHNGTLARLTFGELDGSRSARAERLLAACQGAAFDAVLSEHVQRDIWEKFVFIVGLSGLTALTRLPIGPIREDPLTRELFAEVMREAAAVGRAKAVDLGADAIERQLAFADKLPPGMIASMLGDLHRGNRLELPWLTGAVVRLGDALGVPVPANRFVYAALKLHAEGRHPAAQPA